MIFEVKNLGDKFREINDVSLSPFYKFESNEEQIAVYLTFYVINIRCLLIVIFFQ